MRLRLITCILQGRPTMWYFTNGVTYKPLSTWHCFEPTLQSSTMICTIHGFTAGVFTQTKPGAESQRVFTLAQLRKRRAKRATRSRVGSTGNDPEATLMSHVKMIAPSIQFQSCLNQLHRTSKHTQTNHASFHALRAHVSWLSKH